MYKAIKFEDAAQKACELSVFSGWRHTSSSFIDAQNERVKIDVFDNMMETWRILVNTPTSQGGIGNIYNFMLTPSMTLGCD